MFTRDYYCALVVFLAVYADVSNKIEAKPQVTYGVARRGHVSMMCDPSGQLALSADNQYSWKSSSHGKGSKMRGSDLTQATLTLEDNDMHQSGRYTCTVTKPPDESVYEYNQTLVMTKLRGDGRNTFQDMHLSVPLKSCAGKDQFIAATDKLINEFGPDALQRNDASCSEKKILDISITPVIPSGYQFSTCSTKDCFLQKLNTDMDQYLTKFKDSFVKFIEGDDSNVERQSFDVGAVFEKFQLKISKVSHCEEGYAGNENDVVCEPCAPGYYGKSMTCEQCIGNTYQDHYGERSCKTCSGSVSETKDSCDDTNEVLSETTTRQDILRDPETTESPSQTATKKKKVPTATLR